MSEVKACPFCGQLMSIAHDERGIVRFDVSDQYPANVWACEHCWHEEPYVADNQVSVEH